MSGLRFSAKSAALLSLAAMPALSACGDTVPLRHQELLAAEATRVPEAVMFMYDRSGSIQVHQLEHAHSLVSERVGRLTHGDHIAAIQVLQRSVTEVPLRWSQAIPARERDDLVLAGDSISRERFVRDAVTYLENFVDPTGREEIQGTDVISTLHDVAEEFRPLRGTRKTLVIFSDMLQSTPEIEMEGGRRMPESRWVFDAAGKGILPDLAGICVVVVGGRIDTALGQSVKAFWKQYFDAAGATLYDRNYSYRPVQLPPGDACA